MRKRSYFDVFKGSDWPQPSQLERFFFAPKGQEWSYRGGNDSWGLHAEGADGTEHLEERQGRIDLHLEMWGKRGLGVLLIYSKLGGGYSEIFSSKGDLSRLSEWVRTLHYDPMPVGLYVPFEAAWKAVKEFIETDGQLPKSIEWIANSDLPPDTFPRP